MNEVHLYRFHPVTGEDAQAIYEPDFPRPDGLTDEQWERGRDELNAAKMAGWLPYWEKSRGEWSRVMDANVMFIAKACGLRLHKHERRA